MKVLLLSPYPERLRPTLAAFGDEVRSDDAPLVADRLGPGTVDWIVSYGYRHLIREPLLGRFAGRIVNLHISYLPWNRGADPNFWSWFDDTPKGVTIHLVDRGIDTGDILAQEEVRFSGQETLSSSYRSLQGAIETLFASAWPRIRNGETTGVPQVGPGSLHKRLDKEAHVGGFGDLWNAPVREIELLGAAARKAAMS